MMEKFKSFVFSMLLIIIMILCLSKQQAVSEAVLSAMKRCVYSVIPSLFANSVLTSVIAKSGIVSWQFSKITDKAKEIEFFILGNLGGYTIGANLLSEAVDRGEISEKEAERIFKYCYSPGPAFCVGVIGIGLYGCSLYGWIIYSVCTVSNLICFLIMHNKICNVNRLYRVNMITSKDITSSVGTSANGMVIITAITSIFAVINSLISAHLQRVKLYYFTYLFDITQVLSSAEIPFWLLCGLVVFGGMCIICQIISINDNRFSLKSFYISILYKVPISMILGLLSERVLKKIGTEAMQVIYSDSESIIPIMCVMFMLYITIAKRNPDRFRSG